MAQLIELKNELCRACGKKATHLLTAVSGGIVGFYCEEHASSKYEEQDYAEDPEKP